jgi:hypothetical protein
MATDGRRVYSTLVDALDALDVKNGERLWAAFVEGDTGQSVRTGRAGLHECGRRRAQRHLHGDRRVTTDWQIGALGDEQVVVTSSWLCTLEGNVVAAYAP